MALRPLRYRCLNAAKHANLVSVSVAKHHRVPPNAEALRGSALHHRIQSTVSVNRRLIGDGRTKATFDLTFLVI